MKHHVLPCAAAILASLASASSAVPQDATRLRPPLLPGQLWASGGEQFVVQDRLTVKGFGICVAVRITGRKTLRDLQLPFGRDRRDDLAIEMQSVYPESLLTRWADRKITTVPAELIASWPKQRWLAAFADGRVNLRTVSPTRWSQERTRYVQEAIRHLPSVDAHAPGSDPIHVEILTLEAGRRVAGKVEGRELVYRVNGREAASEDALKTALRSLARTSTDSQIFVNTQKGALYADVAGVVDLITSLGFRRLDFGFPGAPRRGGSTAKVKLEPGQIWSHRVAPGSKPSRLQILCVTSVPDFGEIVGVRFLDLPEIPGGLSPWFGGSTLMLMGSILRGDLRQRLGTEPIPSEGAIDVQTWGAEFRAGDAGFATIRPEHLVHGRRRWAEAERKLQNLPPFLPPTAIDGQKSKPKEKK